MKFESLVLELEVGGLPAAVEEKWAKDASVVRLHKVEFLNYSRFITAVTRWIPSEERCRWHSPTDPAGNLNGTSM